MESQFVACNTDGDLEHEEAQVSVGLPVYNGGDALRRTIDSLLGQTFGNIELHISDNASTDETSAICADYASADPRVRYHRQQRNIGANADFEFVLRQL